MFRYESDLSTDRYWRWRDDARVQGLRRSGGPALLWQRRSLNSHLFRESGLCRWRWRSHADDIHMPGLRRSDSAMLRRSNLHEPSQLHRRIWWGSDLQLVATAGQSHRRDCSSGNAHVESINRGANWSIAGKRAADNDANP